MHRMSLWRSYACKEEKLDAILREINPKEAEKVIASLDDKYPRR